MTENQRNMLIGLYVAGLIFFVEGFLELVGGFWESSGQRHIALGALFLVIVVGWFKYARKKAANNK